MNSHQRRKENRAQSRGNLRVVRNGGQISTYGLSALERRELRRIAVAVNCGEDGWMYTLAKSGEAK